MATIDYSKFGDGAPKKDEATGGVQRRWWLSDLSEDEKLESVSATIEHLKKRQTARLTQHVIAARLYGNLSVLGFGGLGFLRLSAASGILKEKISYNVVQSATDTVTAKIGKNRPRPLFLTSGGDYKLQRRAKKLNQFIDGVFYENSAYEQGVSVFRDGAVFGDGIIKVFAENGRVKLEKTLASELWVDELEGFYGYPRSLHQTKNVDRQVLFEMFPKLSAADKAKLKDTNGARPDETGDYAGASDLVTVRESWHLPSGPKASDGRRMITVQNLVLWEGDYDQECFPFARFRWCPRLYGYWSQGLAEQLQNIQLEINKLLQLIQRSFHLGGTFKVLLENTSKVVPEHLNNDVGAIIRYSGTKPEYVVPPLVPQEIFGHLITLKTAAFEQAGISMLSATSQKPAGLNSGRALREYADIESDRFMTIGKAYEEFFLELARLTILTAKDIARNGKSIAVKAPMQKFMRTIEWKDVALDEDDYVMQVYPVSSLPNDPAGRLETVQEYMQAGLLTPRQGKRLLDFPDLEQVENLQNAAEDYLEMVLEKIVEDGEYTIPEPYDDLQLGKEMALEHYAYGKNQGLEEDRLELLRRFLADIDRLQMIAMPPPQMGPPQAEPEPAPQSPMVQNQPGIPGLAA